MSTNNDSRCGSSCNTNYDSTYPSTGTGRGTSNPGSNSSTSTCTEVTIGTTCEANAITSPGCYVCNWNGSLLRVTNSCFTTSNSVAFSYACSDPLTVTFLSNDPTATLEQCRTIANGAHVYSNF